MIAVEVDVQIYGVYINLRILILDQKRVLKLNN